MDNESLYILEFEPILKEKIWGGSNLGTYLNKPISGKNIGESWEISDVPGDVSIVSTGFLKGKSLSEIISIYGKLILGKRNLKRFGLKFPLLIKFIDAKENLSVQLHPGDEIAMKKHDSLGKTEMWHIIQADKDAEIIIGFNKKVTEKEYQNLVDQKDIATVLNREKVKPGDTFFVYAGLIHAIGAGVLLAEIQQTSDITYRIYDWDRKDADGNYRELHQQEALEAIDYDSSKRYKVNYADTKDQIESLVTCPHFITNSINVTTSQKLSHKNIDSFVIYICVEGSVVIQEKNIPIEMKTGKTILVPAAIEEVQIVSGKGRILQVYI